MKKITEELPERFNIAAYFLEESRIQEWSEKTVFYYKDETYTYSQLGHFVKCTAQLFSKLGLEQENRIAILLPDTPEFVFAFWGAIWLGAVPVPINTASTIEDIQYILHNSRAKILVTTQEWKAQLTPLQSQFLHHYLLTDGEDSFLSLLSQQDERLPCAETYRDEPAFWLYTSGSTGRPKGAIHLHQNMVVCAESYAKATLGLQRDDITYSVAKMPFAYGLGNTLYMPMSVGAASVLSDANNAFDIIADIQRYRPTVLFGIPSIYANLLALQNIAPLDSSCLRLCVSAAEQLPQTIWQQWLEVHNQEICEGIGTTEFLHIFLSNRVGKCKPGSSGYPVPGYNLQIVNDEGLPCAVDEIGNLQVRGESLMLGYWNRLQQTRKVICENTMKTGDKYRFDSEGYFWFMGRKDDLFKANGQWVSPLEIENILHQHPQVLEVAAIPNSERGEQLTEIVAYISLKSKRDVSSKLANEIRQYAKQQLPHYKAPKTIHFVERLPRTSTGKIHRQKLMDDGSIAKISLD